MADAVELAVAYIQIVPSMRGAQGQIAKEMGVEGDKGGKEAGSRFGSGFGKALKTVGKYAAGAVGVVTTAFSASKIFGGGMARLMGIEEAQAKMRGLGHDSGAVSKIMDNALASVRGTSFGMADAATVAANAVAAGIEPGDRLERVLKTVSNSAAAAGSDLGSMGDIFNNVATTNRAYNGTLQQVARRGIPIYQKLAEQLGITADEVRAMASKGEIDFATFEAAMSSASGNVAAEIGGTLRGSLDNMNAALGRIGANLLEQVFPRFAPIIQGITARLGTAEDAAKEWGIAIGDGVDWAIEKWGSFSGQISGFADSARGILDSLVGNVRDFGTGFVDGFGGVEGILTSVKDLLPLVTGPFGLLGAAMREVFADGAGDATSFGETFGAAIRPLIDVAIDLAGILVSGLADALVQILPLAAELGMTLLPVIAQLAGALLPVFGVLLEALAPIIGNLVTAVAPLIAALAEALVPLIQALVDLILPILIPVITVLAGVLTGALQGALQGVTWMVEGLTKVIDGLVGFVTAIFNGDWRAAWDNLVQIVTGVIQFVGGAIWTWLNVTILGAIRGGLVRLASTFTGGWNGIRTIFSTALGWIRGLVSNVWSAITGFFRGGITNARTAVSSGLTAVRNTFSSVLNAARGIVSSAWTAIRGFFTSGINGARTAATNGMTAIRNAISNGINAVLGFFRSLPSRIVSALGNVGSLLSGAGRSLISGFTKGITSAFNGALDAVRNGMKKIRNFFPFSPAKTGPFAGSGYTDRSGTALMRDFGRAIAHEGGKVQGVLDDVMRDASATLNVGVTPPRAAAAAAGIGPGGITINGPLVGVDQMNVRNDGDIRKISQELQRQIEARLRAIGK